MSSSEIPFCRTGVQTEALEEEKLLIVPYA
jgi:hypothetical protein